MPREATNSGAMYLGNKILSIDQLLDPALQGPSIYEIDPTIAEREQRYPFTRTVQDVPLNMLEAETRKQNSRRRNDEYGELPAKPQNADKFYRDYTNHRPQATFRQAWTSHPTFRYFKRSQRLQEEYRRPTVRDYTCGDKYYIPKTIEQERARNERIYYNFATRGPPRRGEW